MIRAQEQYSMSEVDRKRNALVSSAAVAAISLFVLSILGSAGVALAAEIPEDAEIPDQGEFWSLRIFMVFAGSDAETIEWDFGDGTPVSTEWNPVHTYAAPGDYIVTQTVYNSYNGGSSATAYYLLHVMGNPYVEVIQPAGAPAIDKIYADVHTAAVQPEDPVWEGHQFLGWYADEELTAPFDWSQGLEAPVSVYASWSDVAPGVTEHTLTIRGGDGNIVDTITVEDGHAPVMPVSPEGKTVTYYIDSGRTIEFDWTAPMTSDVTIYQTVSDIEIVPVDDGIVIGGTDLILIAGIIMFGIAAIASRSPGVTVVVLILIAIAALGILDVVELPELIEGFEGVRL
jgi:hypothetical protein